MPQCDPRVDSYIGKSAEFARPILRRVREIVHEGCPQVEETLKWGMPTFVYAGSILGGMAAFKHHASFGFWKHAQVLGEGVPREGMGSYGKMSSLKDLPPKKILLAHIKKAMQLNQEGAKSSSPRRLSAKPPAEIPADLHAALNRNKSAKAAFDAFPPSAQRDYVEWLVQAKREDTRARRLAQAMEWIAEEKRRNWKYEKC